MVLESSLIIFILRENKIRNKTLNMTHNRKNKSIKIVSRSDDYVTYWEDS